MSELSAGVMVTAHVSLGDLAEDITRWTTDLSDEEVIAFIVEIVRRMRDSEDFGYNLRKALG